MKQTYYNTNNASIQQAMNFEAKIGLQNSRVLEIFQLNSFRWLTTREAHAVYLTRYPEKENNGVKYAEPHDSIKRAITQLTESGYLERCSKENMVPGQLGKPVHTWRLKH